MKNYFYLCAALFLILSFKVGAQERQDNAWKAIFTDYNYQAAALRLETHVRTRQFMAENDQYLIRPSMAIKLEGTVQWQLDTFYRPTRLYIAH